MKDGKQVSEIPKTKLLHYVIFYCLTLGMTIIMLLKKGFRLSVSLIKLKGGEMQKGVSSRFWFNNLKTNPCVLYVEDTFHDQRISVICFCLLFWFFII